MHIWLGLDTILNTFTGSVDTYNIQGPSPYLGVMTALGIVSNPGITSSDRFDYNF